MESKEPTLSKNGKRMGRPEGSHSRLAKDAREKALATGLLPHEILLSMARGEIQTEQYMDKESGEVLTRMVPVDLEARRDAAKAAAPYFAPKMSTVEVLKTGTDDELDKLIAELASQAGFGPGALGETTTDGAEGSTDSVDDGDEQPATTTRRRSSSFDD